MRKDVKFGLTIGAILVVTLVIYVIVLSRGSSAPQKIAIAMPSASDQTTSENTTDSADPGVTHADDAKTPNADDTDTANVTSSVPAPESSTPAPATQPAPVAQANVDWEGALNHGLPPTLSAPEHTVTPTIDSNSSSNSSSISHGGISRSQSAPTIDSLPSNLSVSSSTPATQPSRPMMADVPTLDAPVAMAPAPSNPAPRSFPSYSIDSASVPASTPASGSANPPRTHRVTSGESAYSISQLVYGSGKYYKRILAANPKIDPQHLKIGQILVIPELNSSDKPANSSAAIAGADAPIDTKTAYRVVSGDTLERISQKIYHTSGMVDKLYDANRGLIGPDENMLKVGWILKLPQSDAAEPAQQ